MLHSLQIHVFQLPEQTGHDVENDDVPAIEQKSEAGHADERERVDNQRSLPVPKEKCSKSLIQKFDSFCITFRKKIIFKIEFENTHLNL